MKKYLMLGILLAGFSISAHAQVSRPPQEKNPAQESINKLLDFVNKYGIVAGSANVCDASYYDNIRLCSLLIVSHWPEVTHETVPLGKGFHDTLEKVWINASEKGMAIQKQNPPPLTCSALVEHLKKESIWAICRSLANTPQQPAQSHKSSIDDGRIQ